jgi:phospholipid transport system substrate-binding protein
MQPKVRENSVKIPEAGRTNEESNVLRRMFSISGLTLFTLLMHSFPAAAETDPAQFISSLGNQTIEVLHDNTSLHQKQTYFHQLLSQDFDLLGISRFILGPYWRLASKPEQQEFQQLFEYHLMMTYGPRLADDRLQVLRVTGTRLDPLGLVVKTQIMRSAGAEPISVDWRLCVCDGLYKINDIVIDGISMVVTQRFEITQMIQRNGGQIESLLAIMRQRR